MLASNIRDRIHLTQYKYLETMKEQQIKSREMASREEETADLSW